jgi:C4-type Zn-finger protein
MSSLMYRLICPYCTGPELSKIEVCYDASVSDLVEYYRYSCNDCGFRFLVKADEA